MLSQNNCIIFVTKGDSDMGLKITEIHNSGDYNQEYIEFLVIADCNLNDYAVYDTTYNMDDEESNTFPHFFRFPYRQARAGETIKLHTGKDIFIPGWPKFPTSFQTDFYWGAKKAIWNNIMDKAHLIKIADTQELTSPTYSIRRLLDSIMRS